MKTSKEQRAKSKEQRAKSTKRGVVICYLLFVICSLFLVSGLFAQHNLFEEGEFEKGDAAVAEKYLLWAEDTIAAGRWAGARAALERAADFADVSSDISYLLALARLQENESRRLVLQSLEKAIGTGRWNHYTEAQARLMEADQLITLRRYSAALDTLAVYKTIAGETADYALLRLAALKGLAASGAIPGFGAFSPLPAPAEFRRRMLETMDMYPRDPRPLRILFDYAQGQEANRDDMRLMEIALRRLPFLLETDPELAWMAAPFMSDVDEARRLVAAYRAGSLKPQADEGFKPRPASIVQALNLGLIDDDSAIEELFTETVVEKEVIVKIHNLLRDDEGRDKLARTLHSFSGAITEDEDRDGYAESRAVYQEGSLQEYYSDTDQDGITDLFISFIAGTPQEAKLGVPPLQEGGRMQAFIFWERYPAVQRAVMGSEIFLPAPGGFPFAPVYFDELGGSNSYAGLVFPRRDPFNQGINRRMLASFAVSVQRPAHLGYGPGFEGGVEQVFLERGIPVRAEVTLNGAVVSVIEFENGYPVIQRLDLDLDGRMETVRRFDRAAGGGQGVLRSSESDWHGGGVFGTAEWYRADGSIVYSWDLDGSGNQIIAP